MTCVNENYIVTHSGGALEFRSQDFLVEREGMEEMRE